MTLNLLNVTFRLFHVPEEVIEDIERERKAGERVQIALVGSLEELGEWDVRGKLVAERGRDRGVWEVRTRLPAGHRFQISWLIVVNGVFVLHWDPSNEHSVRLRHNETAVQVSWGRDPTYMMSRVCVLLLQTHFYCGEGETLAVLGSAPCLGCWAPSRAVQAEEYPRGSGNWTVSVHLSACDEYEWKWVVLDMKTLKVRRWEDGDNSYISTNCEQLHITAPWNCPQTVQSQSSVIHQEVINMDKVCRFYDAVESGSTIDSIEMREMTTDWKLRQQTSEKPYVRTERKRNADETSRPERNEKYNDNASF